MVICAYGRNVSNDATRLFSTFAWVNGVRNWCIGLSYYLGLREISKDPHLYS